MRLRAHDLRGTFVTLSLANGKTETWVMDRTGHQSSGMVNEYRQAARSAAELNLGPLAPLDEAIPELALLGAKQSRCASSTSGAITGSNEMDSDVDGVHEGRVELPYLAVPEPKDE